MNENFEPTLRDNDNVVVAMMMTSYLQQDTFHHGKPLRLRHKPADIAGQHHTDFQACQKAWY